AGINVRACTHKWQRPRYLLMRDTRTSRCHVELVENDPKAVLQSISQPRDRSARLRVPTPALSFEGGALCGGASSSPSSARVPHGRSARWRRRRGGPIVWVS